MSESGTFIYICIQVKYYYEITKITEIINNTFNIFKNVIHIS